jgi:L-lactate dehydrogenase complex protein LldG
MTRARDAILANLRRSLGGSSLDRATEAQLEARIAAHRRNLIPARATAPGDAARVELFIAMAQEVQATIARVDGVAAVPQAIAEYLAGENLAPELLIAPDPDLEAIPWANRPLLQIHRDGTPAADATVVTPAFAGVAETGTLLLVSAPTTPTALNFLPETHVVILGVEQIVAVYEDGWDRLRAAGVMPRAVNFITGPSRTADIEQQIVQGMHGPRRLHIVLVGGGGSAGGRAEPRE